MKKVLVVSPNWPPLAYPDLHRVRMALPFFAEYGWEPLILRIDPDEQPGVQEAALVQTVPGATRVREAGSIPLAFTRWLGLRHAGLRSFFHIARLGDRIIREERPDIVFFSTTMFPLFILGRYWRARHGIPYVLDFQDPWHAGAWERPGAKAAAARAMGALLEPASVRGAAHMVCVSADYPRVLAARYGIPAQRFSVLPFGAPEGDFETVQRLALAQRVFDPRDGHEHWVYAGRGGADMETALRALFLALARAHARDRDRFGRVRLHFIGTSYTAGCDAVETVAPIARACGVGDLVHERPERVGYLESLQCLLDADALVVPGSSDPGYTASKIYPYILARRPLLAVFHENSSVVGVIRRARAGTVVTFNSQDDSERISERLLEQWFRPYPPPAPQTDWAAFRIHGAREMTRVLGAVFDAAAATRDVPRADH
jgi:hypothetical protein